MSEIGIAMHNLVSSGQTKAATTFGTYAQFDVMEIGQVLKVGSMTTTQRDALTAENGWIIYNSTLNKFQGYENGAWANLI
jgi:hypothetical protein